MVNLHHLFVGEHFLHQYTVHTTLATLFELAVNGWRYVFGLPYMAYRVTITACSKLKYTACYVLGGFTALNLI